MDFGRARKRKYKVSVRVKTKRQAQKRVVSVFLALALLSGAGFCAYHAAGMVSHFKRPSWTYWRAAGVTVKGLAQQDEDTIRQVVKVNPGEVVSRADCERFASDIRVSYPFLRDVNVSRSWLTRQVVVSAERRRPIAMLNRGAISLFVDDKGAFYDTDSSSTTLHLLPISVPEAFAGNEFDKNFVSFLYGLIAETDRFPSRPKDMSFNQEASVSLTLEDGSQIDWGSMDFTKEKVSRLAQVYGKMKDRASGPYGINMKYFEDGRILLRKIESQPL